MREQLADQLASNPDFKRFVTNFYSLKVCAYLHADCKQRRRASNSGFYLVYLSCRSELAVAIS